MSKVDPMMIFGPPSQVAQHRVGETSGEDFSELFNRSLNRVGMDSKTAQKGFPLRGAKIMRPCQNEDLAELDTNELEQIYAVIQTVKKVISEQQNVDAESSMAGSQLPPLEEMIKFTALEISSSLHPTTIILCES